MTRKIIDAIISMWVDSEEELRFTQIHQGFVELGIVQDIKYHYKTDRILKKLIKLGLMRKIGKRGPYRLNVEPDEFRVFDHLQTLRQKHKTMRFQVHGHSWTMSQLHFLGMPESVFKYEDAKGALEILGIRIAYLFEAFRILAKKLEKKEREPLESKLLSLPPQVVQELLLELIPCYLGPIGLGLTLNELKAVIPETIQSLPNELTRQRATGSKSVLRNFYKLMIEWEKTKKIHAHYERDFLEKKAEDFALIVVGPEHLIAKSGFEKRWIKNELAKCGLKHKSALYVASLLLHFSRENVLAVLDMFGGKHLGRNKSKETKKLYEKLYASNLVGEIVSGFEVYDEKQKVEARKTVQELVEKHGLRTTVSYLPFSHCPMNFIIPTPQKEKIVKEFFPQLPIETIHEWLNEGVILAEKIGEAQIMDI